jgi:hypothetical protein
LLLAELTFRWSHVAGGRQTDERCRMAAGIDQARDWRVSLDFDVVFGNDILERLAATVQRHELISDGGPVQVFEPELTAIQRRVLELLNLSPAIYRRDAT